MLILIGFTVRHSSPATFEGDIQEIEQENEDEAREEHGYGSKNPQKQRKREVKSTQPQRPEVAASVDGGGDVIGCEDLVAKIRAHFLVGHVNEDACVTVVPYGLNVQQKSQQEAHQYCEKFYRQTQLASIPKQYPNHLIPFFPAGHQHRDERTQHYRRRRQKSRRHYVVPQRLHGQNPILRRVLRITKFKID